MSKNTLQLPELCLGTMTWGQQNTQDQGFAQMDYAWEQGVKFWDTAEMYSVPAAAETYASTETIIGNWLASRGGRDNIILATKVIGNTPSMYWIRQGDQQENGHGVSSSLVQACEDSLQRLQTDYIDLYQLHWPERAVNNFGTLGYSVTDDELYSLERLRNTVKTLGDLISQGKIRHWGLSNESAWGIMKFIQIADELGVPRPLSVQNPYSLLNRSAEVGVAEVCHREGVQFMAYSTLGMGMLTGKYDGGALPAGARLEVFKDHFRRYSGAQAVKASQAYNDLAREFGLEPAHLALAWVNAQPWVQSNIIGGTSVEQLQINVASLEVNLSDELVQRVEEIHEIYTYPAP